MPELPEVETVVRTLAPSLEGRRILDAEFRSARVVRGRPEDVVARLRGRRIQSLRRHGKNILVDLDGGALVVFHLGMTGKLLWRGTPGPHTRAVFQMEGGRLLYDDIRMFGRIEAGETVPERVARLGPDALSLGADGFVERLRQRRGMIKPLLLDQRLISGVGNIYADEALYRARIHPRARRERLGETRLRRLHGTIIEVLAAAIGNGGSSVSNYVDADGRRGSFQLLHRVYQKAGEPCSVCGALIRRIVVAQRGTHYCPRCQRA